MMRAMYSGVSGLRNHQIRMDVIGNNIANVNTTAFKAGRVTFQDILAQTLKVATAPSGNYGGTNPMQIGLGMIMGSIDTDMTQGSLETTGRLTDVGIQGEGFFMVSATGQGGDSDFTVRYTRDGNFALNANKELVDAATGFKVLGWQVGNNTTNPDTTAIDPTLPPTSIELPIGTKKMAKATTKVEYASNLNAESEVRQPYFGFVYVTPTGGTQQRVEFTITEIADESNNHRWEWYAEVTSGGGYIVGPNTGSIIFDDSGLVTANSQTTITIADPDGNQSILSTPAVGTNFGLGYAVLIDTPVGEGTDLEAYFEQTKTGATPTTTYTVENQLQLGTQWVVGANTIRLEWIKGSRTSGTVAGPDDTVNPLDDAHEFDADYWQYTLRVVSGAANFTAVNGVAIAANTAVRGQLILSDSGAVRGGPGAGATFTLSTGETITAPIINSGPDSLTFSVTGGDPSLTGKFNAGDVYRNSVQVYDSLGQPHNLTLRYSKAGVNQWDWVASLPANDGAEDSLSGIYGNLTFNSEGQKPVLAYDPVSGDSYTAISFLPAGANTVNISPNFDLTTQFGGESTIKAISQDGFPMGVLQTFTIETNGIINGIYENGLKQQEAQIALCRFRNPEGLTRSGNNLYLQSPNSGIPMIGEAGTDGYGEIYGGVLEMSNVDLAQEFTEMIITQRGFQANTRIITTTDEMLTDVIGLKR